MAEFPIEGTIAGTITVPSQPYSHTLIEAPPSTNRAQFMQLVQQRLQQNATWEYQAAHNFGNQGWLIIFKHPE